MEGRRLHTHLAQLRGGACKRLGLKSLGSIGSTGIGDKVRGRVRLWERKITEGRVEWGTRSGWPVRTSRVTRERRGLKLCRGKWSNDVPSRHTPGGSGCQRTAAKGSSGTGRRAKLRHERHGRGIGWVRFRRRDRLKSGVKKGQPHSATIILLASTHEPRASANVHILAGRDEFTREDTSVPADVAR
jgi:hypothetical protein